MLRSMRGRALHYIRVVRCVRSIHGEESHRGQLSSNHLSHLQKLGTPNHEAPYSKLAPSPIPDLPRLVNMRHGGKIPNVFSEAEYRGRLNCLRSHMTEQRIEAVVLTSLHNINYYSGLIFYTFGRPYATIITHDDSILLSAGIDGGFPWRRAYGNNITYTDWQRDNFFHGVKDCLENAHGKIGIEFDDVAIDQSVKFKTIFPRNMIVDVSFATMQLRSVKSAEEIDVIRQGARIADLGGVAAADAIREGVSEYEVALASTSAMVREIGRTYPQSDLADTWTWCQSGLNTDGAHNPVTTRQIQKGDIISINCFPMIQGYYTALERTMFLDHASDAHIRYWEANCDVHRRGCQLMRPGVKCSEIAHELNDMYREQGLLQYRSFGYGHSFGSMSHYYGREAGLEIREDIQTVLEPGMVLSMEPMIMILEGRPGAGGYREHDILIITENGSENITKFPFGPEHNIIKN